MSNSFVTPWNVGRQAPLSMGFPRQEYWSGLLFQSPGDLPNPGIESTSPAFFFFLPLSRQESPIKNRNPIIRWQVAGTGEPGGLLSMGSHRVGHD